MKKELWACNPNQYCVLYCRVQHSTAHSTCYTLRQPFHQTHCCRGCRFNAQIKLLYFDRTIHLVSRHIIYLNCFPHTTDTDLYVISICLKCSIVHTHLTNNGKALTFEFNLISFQIHSNLRVCVCAIEYAMHLYYFNDVHSLFRFQKAHIKYIGREYIIIAYLNRQNDEIVWVEHMDCFVSICGCILINCFMRLQ